MEATLDSARPSLSTHATAATAPAARSARARWGGRILSGVPALFLLVDGVMKLVNPLPVAESFTRMGMSPSLAASIGVLELLCLVVYLLPRTAPIGAVLLTGYLGGAISLHVRLGDPLLTHVLFPSYLGALLWAGLFLRDPRLPALLRPRP